MPMQVLTPLLATINPPELAMPMYVSAHLIGQVCPHENGDGKGEFCLNTLADELHTALRQNGKALMVKLHLFFHLLIMHSKMGEPIQ